MELSFPSNRNKIMILEIDSNPRGAVVEDKFLGFPQLHRYQWQYADTFCR